MNAEIVLTGTELLLGEIVDTNSVMVSQMLREIGLDVHYKTTVGDNEQRIIEVLRIALGRVDFVIVSGGLGPTVDDMTRQAAAAATGRKLIYSQELEEQIAARFRKFGRQMAENNKRQAWIPEGAIPVENPVGTAPCFIIETEEGSVICLPGVPRELKYQMENAIIPYLKAKMGETQLIKARILRTCAIGESDIDRTIDDLMRLSNPTIGLAAHLGQVDVRITAKAATEAEADALIAPIEAEVRKRLGDVIFGVDRETLAEVVGQLLKQHQLRLALIDTMTKGAISYSLREAGYSEQVSGETVFDSLVAAQARLGLSAQALANDGEATASHLARQLHQPDAIGLCILGPVTTAAGDMITWVALAHQEQVAVRQSRIAYANETRQPWVIAQALNLVWRQLRGY